MDLIGEKVKIVSKQLRCSWSFLTFVVVFVLVLWTFQLALIVRFQAFWPSGRTYCFSDQDDSPDSKGFDQRASSHASSSLKDPRYKIVCYYIVDSNFTSNEVRTININPFLCTHINVGFAMIVNGTLVPREPDDIQVYGDLINLKSINPHLKIILSVQEFSSPSGEFSKVVSSDEKRKMFSDNIIKYLSKYKFDGFDIDWEFPSWPTSDPSQKKNFTLLLSEIYSSMKNSDANYTLSVAVGAPAIIFLQCYEISEMAKYVDWVNLMSYDYHMYTKLTPTTGPNAPLYQRPRDSTFFATLNTNWSASHWAFWGMPKSKIIIGIPTYGHSFRLMNTDNTGWYAPAVGLGSIGEAGFTKYSDACGFLAAEGTTHVWDDHYRVPYAFSGPEWISYESLDSVRHKANLVKGGSYGGAMVFSLNVDDGKGVCRQGSFPLTSVIHSVLRTSS